MIKTKITKVTMFKSSDDKLHATALECELHDIRLSVKPIVNEMLAHAGFGQEFDDKMSIDEVSDFISANSDALLKILAPLLPKKVRVPRATSADIKAAPNVAAQGTQVPSEEIYRGDVHWPSEEDAFVEN